MQKTQTLREAQTILKYSVILILMFTFSGCGREAQDTQKPSDSQTAAIDSTHVSDSTAFVIQIAAFRDSSNAQNLKKVLSQTNLPATIVTAPGLTDGIIYRVQIGPYPTEEQTRDVQKTVKRLGFEDAFLKKSVISISPTDSTEQITQEVEKKQLTFSGTSRQPHWSPSGREIAFYKRENGIAGLYTIGTGGGPISKIIEEADGLTLSERFAWAPSGRQIAFVAEEVNRDFEKVENLYIVNKNGRDLHKIIAQESTPYFAISGLRWSPDDQHIAFDASYGTRDSGVESFRIAFVANTSREPTARLESLSDAPPSQVIGWRSEHEILFLSHKQKKEEGWRQAVELRYFDLRVKRSSLVTDGSYLGKVHSLDLLPNGKFVVYTSRVKFGESADGEFSKIAVLHLESGADNVLFEAELQHQATPPVRLTQDNRIVFLANNQLWICEPSGKRATLDLRQSASDFTVSPRGRKVCFVDQGLLYSQNIEE